MSGEAQMVTINGIRYRHEDALDLGLIEAPKAKKTAKAVGAGVAETVDGAVEKLDEVETAKIVRARDKAARPLTK